MNPSSAAAAGDGGEAAAAAHQCRGCSTPRPWAALLGRFGMLMFATSDSETRDLCSRCLLEYYYRTGGLGAVRSHGTCPFAFAAAAATAAATPPAAREDQRPRLPGRCAACTKKVGLLGFACRCGGTFCSTHRHADTHACSFDHRGFARDREAGTKNL